LFSRSESAYIITDQQGLYWSYFSVFTSASVWFCILISVFTAVIPDIIYKVYENVNQKFIIQGKKQDLINRFDNQLFCECGDIPMGEMFIRNNSYNEDAISHKSLTVYNTPSDNNKFRIKVQRKSVHFQGFPPVEPLYQN
jgi:hypothetical protein